jgi:DNA mismatch repair protein MSH5
MEKDISATCDVCAELDCLLAFAQASRTFDYRRPIMVEDDIMDVTGGRCVPFVPRVICNKVR